MQKEDIFHLASLARIRITDTEAEALLGDIESVLAYVSDINAITANTEITKTVGARYNIFREDIVTNEPESYTEALLKEAPKVHGRHMLVKKIIQTD
jgi:aspartyl/glutamyl-tRNA(Asn/Gln) amidotransferase C subunit